MPELPEVETIARSLRDGGITGESILNRQILSADLFNVNTLSEGGPVDALNGQIRGKRIRSVNRRGKLIHIRADGVSILIHLRMSGVLRLESEDAERRPHDRMVFHFTDGTRLVFNDVRKFGRITVTERPDIPLSRLGMEPLDPDFHGEWLYHLTRGKKTKLKSLLLDQSLIAGIGNIYADESLFLSGLHPLRAAGSLTLEECLRLCDTIKSVLSEAIDHHGSSFDWAYRGGEFQNYFHVYQRQGEPCPLCGGVIEKTRVGQRGTHYCPKCQPEVQP